MGRHAIEDGEGRLSTPSMGLLQCRNVLQVAFTAEAGLLHSMRSSSRVRGNGHRARWRQMSEPWPIVALVGHRLRLHKLRRCGVDEFGAVVVWPGKCLFRTALTGQAQRLMSNVNEQRSEKG